MRAARQNEIRIFINWSLSIQFAELLLSQYGPCLNQLTGQMAAEVPAYGWNSTAEDRSCTSKNDASIINAIEKYFFFSEAVCIA